MLSSYVYLVEQFFFLLSKKNTKWASVSPTSVGFRLTDLPRQCPHVHWKKYYTHEILQLYDTEAQ